MKENPSVPSSSIFFKNENYNIPVLPLLDDMVELIKKEGELPDLSHTVFIGVQHILETTVTLFDAIISLGVKPENMFFSGKCYSSSIIIEQQVKKRGIYLMPNSQPKKLGEYEEYCQESIVKLWKVCVKKIKNNRVDRIIILDEGGRCIENIPTEISLNYQIASIEQTRGGLYTQAIDFIAFPLIEVASCAVKKILEPSLIATAIVNIVIKKIDHLILSFDYKNKNKKIFGLIGNGSIGNSICKYLLSLGYNVVVYDEDENAFNKVINNNFFRMNSIGSVIANADIIFGCTGKDVTEGIDLLSIIKQDKIFISCTSEDKEFRSLLRTIANKNISYIDTLSDVSCLTNNGRKIIVLQGGFPINFDRTPWNVPANSIEITQGLLLGSCYQAIICATKAINNGMTINKGSRNSLDSYIQKYVAIHWLKRQINFNDSEKYIDFFSNINVIEKNSGGDIFENKKIQNCFVRKKAVEKYGFLSKL